MSCWILSGLGIPLGWEIGLSAKDTLPHCSGDAGFFGADRALAWVAVSRGGRPVRTEPDGRDEEVEVGMVGHGAKTKGANEEEGGEESVGATSGSANCYFRLEVLPPLKSGAARYTAICLSSFAFHPSFH